VQQLQSWKQRFHHASAAAASGELLQEPIARRRSNVGESSSSALGHSGTTGQKETKQKEPPLWIIECQEMVNDLSNTFMTRVNNRVSIWNNKILPKENIIIRDWIYMFLYVFFYLLWARYVFLRIYSVLRRIFFACFVYFDTFLAGN
jgi:hypothetical protein